MMQHRGWGTAARDLGVHLGHNLTAQPTQLFGRQHEVEQVCQMLLASDPAIRMLTLTGAGGTGKTRLALATAERLLDRFGGGVYFVDLVPVLDAQFVPSAIARALGLPDSGDRPIFDRLLDFIGDERLLLVLDNFEHVMAAARRLGELLSACPGVMLLVTSRARLRLRWEHVRTVPPLEVPDLEHLPAPEALAGVASVALFVERARAIDPDFVLTPDNAPTVAELCVRLDGLPLALELAAARVDVLAPRTIVERLDHPLELLSVDPGDVPARHSTMRRAVAWSYDLLTPAEQRLFRRLAIFSAGCLAQAAAEVCSEPSTVQSGTDDVAVLEGLASLTSKSLLRRETQADGVLRFGMLQSIRAFGLEQLAEHGELEETFQRLTAYLLALAETAEPNLTGPRQAAWLEALEREHDNVSSALRWCVDRDAAEEALRLCGALWRFWFTRQHLTDGSRWLVECLELKAAAHARPETRAKALNGAGNLAHARGELAQAAEFHQSSLAVRRSLGDRRGIAISLNSLANVAVDRGDYELARALHEDSLALRRELGDRRGIAIALNNLSVIARDEKDWQRAGQLSRESAALFEALDDRHGVALSLVTLGAALHHLGAHAEATALHRQCLAVFYELGNRREIAECLEVIAMLAATREWYVQAARLFSAAETTLEELGSTMGPSVNPRYAATVGHVRARLGAERFTAAWADGRSMTTGEAMAAAFEGEPARVPRTTTRGTTASDQLTRREQDVAALVARGLSNRQIARTLTISERTAETHVCKILSKLGLKRRAQLTAWALKHDLHDVEEVQPR
jgi:non-specific serine/threonine protein kinase